MLVNFCAGFHKLSLLDRFSKSNFKTHNWINSQTKTYKEIRDKYDIYSVSPTPFSLVGYIHFQWQIFKTIFIDYWTSNFYTNIALWDLRIQQSKPKFSTIFGVAHEPWHPRFKSFPVTTHVQPIWWAWSIRESPKSSHGPLPKSYWVSFDLKNSTFDPSMIVDMPSIDHWDVGWGNPTITLIRGEKSSIPFRFQLPLIEKP